MWDWHILTLGWISCFLTCNLCHSTSSLISFHSVKNGLDGTTFEMTVCEKMLAVTLDNFETKRGHHFGFILERFMWLFSYVKLLQEIGQGCHMEEMLLSFSITFCRKSNFTWARMCWVPSRMGIIFLTGKSWWIISKLYTSSCWISSVIILVFFLL